MSVIRCDSCEKQIDTDYEETEPIGDKEYCIPCYEEKKED